MQVDKISVKNFRNLPPQEITFEPQINVICGSNGMGKTNLLESIYFASIGRSPRTRKDSECIAFGAHTANINLQYFRSNLPRSIDITFGSRQTKSLILDGTPTPKISEIVGNFGSVYFSPDETQIVRGSPSFRRRFIDIINCQISREYMQALSRYQHAISQRNNYLKNIKPLEYTLELESWDQEIAKYCAFVIKRRALFIQQLSTIASEIHKNLSNGIESISLQYNTILDTPNQKPLDEIIYTYQSGARSNFQKDKILGYSTFGAHNDDFDITLNYIDAINKDNTQSISIRRAGSLGQQRTATLSLKLAEVEILSNEYGEPPVLLLDDVLGELDIIRRQKLLEYCKLYQTIITCTEWHDELPATIFSVKNGVVQRSTQEKKL